MDTTEPKGTAQRESPSGLLKQMGRVVGGSAIAISGVAASKLITDSQIENPINPIIYGLAVGVSGICALSYATIAVKGVYKLTRMLISNQE